MIIDCFILMVLKCKTRYVKNEFKDIGVNVSIKQSINSKENAIRLDDYLDDKYIMAYIFVLKN